MASPASENSHADTHGISTAVSSAPAVSTDITLSDALATLRKRKYVVIVVALLGILYGIYKGDTQPRIYVASGEIEIRNGSSNQFRVGGGEDSYSGSARLYTEVSILKSDTLLFTVAQDLDLANNPEFLGLKSRPARRANYADPAVHQAIVAELSGVIQIFPVNKTDLIIITATTFNPNLSSDIVNKLVAEYITFSFQSRVDSTNRAANFLSVQLNDLKNQVENSESQMIDLQKNLGVDSLDPSQSEISSSLATLTSAVSNAEINRIMAQSRYRVLTDMNRTDLDQTVANEGKNLAASHLSELRSTRDAAMTNYARLTAPGNMGPRNPAVEALSSQIKVLDKQIQEEETRVLAQARETLIAAQAEEASTRGALDAEKTETDKLRNDLIQYGIRQREFEAERTLYEGLEARLRTATVQAGLESTEIEIIDHALPPSSPSMQAKSSFVVVDGFSALAIGMILAFLLEGLDNGLRSIADIEAVSGLPSLALIPRARRTGADVSSLSIPERNIVALSNPKSQFTEAFRALRTSLLLSTPGGFPKIILLTSATPSEGKTTIATNLACVLAQSNVRVLLIDADLRRPTIHHRLGLNGKVGLTSILTGAVPLEKAVQQLDEIPNLDILVSGPVPPFPTEMLGSDTMSRLLEECKGIYTHVIIDSPPLLSVTDGVILATRSDAVVMIVRHGRSSKQTVRRARELLVRAHAPVTGVAINAVDLSSPEYYGYYGYSVYAGYGAATAESSAWSPRRNKDDQDQDNDRKGEGR